MARLISSLLLFSYCVSSWAAIIDDQVYGSTREHIELKQACEIAGIQDAPLIDVVDGGKLDCMGKKVDPLQVCSKKFADRANLIRAWGEAKDKEVVCQFARRMVIKYQCSKFKEKHLCQNADKGCAELKQRLSHGLPLLRATQTKSPKGVPEVNCYFDSP